MQTPVQLPRFHPLADRRTQCFQTVTLFSGFITQLLDRVTQQRLIDPGDLFQNAVVILG